MKNIMKTVSDALNRGAEYLLIALIACISILIFVQVVFRYGFNHSLYWSEEIGRYTLVWITFIGASVGFKRKAHVGVDFLFKALNRKVQNSFTLISDVSIFILSLILLIYGVKLALFVRFQTSAALLIPMSVPYSAVWVGGFLTAVHSLQFLVSDFLKFNSKKDPDEVV